MRFRVTNAVGVVALLAGPILCGAGGVAAQTASQLTPETFAPPLQDLDGAIVFSGAAGTEAPPGAETIGITLSDVRVEGTLAPLASATEVLRARLTRGRVPVSELFAAVADLEAAYADAGFVLTRVVLPQQSLRDGGVLRVEVVSGFIEEVDAASVPAPVRDRVNELTAPLVGRAGITLGELERQLLLAGEVAGTALSSALATGQQPGGTILALEAQYRRSTAFIGFDTSTDADLGQPVLNFGVELNSALRLGETFYGRMSFTPEDLFDSDPRYRIAAVGALLPLGASGLTLNLEATGSDTRPDDPVTPTRSRFDRQSVRLLYPFVRSRDVSLTGQFILDLQQDEQDLLAGGGSVPVYRDRTTVARIGADATWRHENDTFTESGIVLSQGVDAFDARTRADAAGTGVPLSRAGADAKFTKLSGYARHQRSLGERFTLTVNGRFQTSFGQPLATAEQFGLVGASSLSAFDAGTLRGDSGWVVRAEVSMPQQTQWAGRGVQVAPYAFGGYGAATLERPTAVEQQHTAAAAYGIGLDLVLEGDSPFAAGSARLEFGRGERNDGGSTGNRFLVLGNLRF
jgi:hemolysin activation/secretion protein